MPLLPWLPLVILSGWWSVVFLPAQEPARKYAMRSSKPKCVPPPKDWIISATDR